jgi:hypothetical protein
MFPIEKLPDINVLATTLLVRPTVLAIVHY